MWFIPLIFILFLISGTAFAYLMGAVSVVTFIAVDKAQFLSILPVYDSGLMPAEDVALWKSLSADNR